MPIEWPPAYVWVPCIWSRMDRHARKEFHRENESRVRRGLKPKVRPR